jgi:hypothetical protein
MVVEAKESFFGYVLMKTKITVIFAKIIIIIAILI